MWCQNIGNKDIASKIFNFKKYMFSNKSEYISKTKNSLICETKY